MFRSQIQASSRRISHRATAHVCNFDQRSMTAVVESGLTLPTQRIRNLLASNCLENGGLELLYIKGLLSRRIDTTAQSLIIVSQTSKLADKGPDLSGVVIKSAKEEEILPFTDTWASNSQQIRTTSGFAVSHSGVSRRMVRTAMVRRGAHNVIVGIFPCFSIRIICRKILSVIRRNRSIKLTPKMKSVMP